MKKLFILSILILSISASAQTIYPKWLKQQRVDAAIYNGTNADTLSNLFAFSSGFLVQDSVGYATALIVDRSGSAIYHTIPVGCYVYKSESTTPDFFMPSVLHPNEYIVTEVDGSVTNEIELPS